MPGNIVDTRGPAANVEPIRADARAHHALNLSRDNIGDKRLPIGATAADKFTVWGELDGRHGILMA